MKAAALSSVASIVIELLSEEDTKSSLTVTVTAPPEVSTVMASTPEIFSAAPPELPSKLVVPVTVKVSDPVPAVIVSAFARFPARAIVSAPAPVVMLSSPVPAITVSSPVPASTVSLPAPALIESAPAPPMSAPLQRR